MAAATQTLGMQPSWLVQVERLLTHAARFVRPLSALTPVAAHVERARLVTELRTGGRPSPRWTYAPWEHDPLRRALEAAEDVIARSAETPIERVYLGRVRELSVEAALCAAAGTPAVGSLARSRFESPSIRVQSEASAAAACWLADERPVSPCDTIVSDAEDERSLLSRMRRAVGRFRLPFSVMPSATLTPLAATGDRYIFVATGRAVTEDDVARTVLHEIEGHAMPRARSLTAVSALFRAGTARGADDQEGRALLLEERAGLLGPSRRRQLAGRHKAVEWMLDGGTFADVARALVDVHGFEPPEAVIVAERAFRGGDGDRPGVGRERVYLEALVRVRAHLAARPDDERILESGQIAAEATDALRPLVAGMAGSRSG